MLIPPEPGDIFGHADGVVQLVDERRAVINDYRAVDRRYGREVERILKTAGIEFARIPYAPTDRVRDDIASAEGVYVNYLHIGKVVLCPIYSQPADEPAMSALAEAIEDARIIPIDCRGLCHEGGSVHCCTWDALVI